MACLVSGLIVGAIIRYTSKAMDRPDFASAKVVSDRTYYVDDAPAILYVNYSDRNTTGYSIKQYDMSGTVDEPIDTEPLLERTVCKKKIMLESTNTVKENTKSGQCFLALTKQSGPALPPARRGHSLAGT